MNVLVVGGTGFIGTALCEELVERGHEVTALSRHPDDADLPDGVETVVGDATAYDSIEGAFEGQDVVVNLVALSPLFQPPGNLTHEGVHLRGTENIVRAADAHDVPRLIQLSQLGADLDAPTEFLRVKGRAEEVVKSSDLRWTIFRPSVVFGDGSEFVPFTKKVTPGPIKALPGGGRNRFQPIWIGDLAPMIVDAIENEEHAGEVYEIGGPEVLTLADVTRLAYAADGKSARIVPVPMPLAKLGLTIAGPIPFIPMGPDQARSLDIDNVTENNDATAFGVEPEDFTTLREYLGLA